MLPRVLVLVAAVAAMAASVCPAQEADTPLPLGKRLIEYGWDVPFSDFVRDHIGEMEQRPFDGLIFKLRGGGKVLTPTPWDPAQFEQDYEVVQQIAWDRFTHNFVIMWAASDQDWFNDAHWEAIEHNVRLAGKAARLAGCVGVCFDAEPYGTNPWHYSQAAHRDTKTFEEYEAKTKERGAQFMRAIEAELPNPHVLTFFMLSYLARLCAPMEAEKRARFLSHEHYGLLPAFLNGMLEGAGPGVKIIDGNESAYYYTESGPYFEKYHAVTQRGRYLIDPALWPKYRAQVEMGQALYIDQYFGLRASKVLGNFMTAEERPKWFEHNVYWALYTTDSYVWCYSERMNWWTDQGVPPGCEDAIRSARGRIAAGKRLGFDLAPIVEAAKGREKDTVAHNLLKRTAEVPRLAQGASPPTVDGRLDDPAWQNAASLEPFLALASMPGSVKAATKARIAWDGGRVYVGVRCDEPETAQMQIAGEKRDDYVFAGEVVEFFLTPPGESSTCYQFAVNPGGVFWDGRHNADLDITYDPEWARAAHVGDDFWSVEMAIPWKAVGMDPPAPGTKLRVNVCRERRGGHELSAWSPTIRLFLEPEHFGTWVFK